MNGITRWSDRGAWPTGLKERFFLPGDWDENLVGGLNYYYQKSRNYRSTLQLFHEGVPYRQCDQYRFLQGMILSGEYHPDLEGRGRAEDELDEYFAHLQNIYSDIAVGGYLSQRQLGLAGVNEIMVVLNRRGEPVRVGGGNHRFAIAQVLGVERVPVCVVGVHEKWALQQFEKSPRRDLALALQLGLRSLSITPEPRSDAAERQPAGTR